MKQTSDKIAWIVTCFNELEYMQQCIPSIRRCDNGPIIIINDGGDSTGLKELAGRNNCKYIDGDNLKLPNIGWLWWRRFFDEGLKEDVDYIIKLDPDAYFHRPLSKPIGNLNFFGTTADRETRNNFSVQGGIQGYSRRYAEKIISSGLLPEETIPVTGDPYPLFISNKMLWFDLAARKKFGLGTESAVVNQVYIHGIRPDRSFSSDVSIKFINEHLKQRGETWDEIFSVWGLWDYKTKSIIPTSPSDGIYAITHPHGPGESFKIADDHIARFKVCAGCDNYDAMRGICNVNNKYIYATTKLVSGACPEGRWENLK